MSTPTGTASPSSPMSLRDVTSPQVLREFAPGELPALAGQIRAFLIAKVGATGGHLGPNLGVVELTIALHRVFDSPHDVLVFDIGHQGYVHKLLTGRQDRFDTLRQAGGLSGYLSRAESPHDLMENSHASTALSYADGLVKARHLVGGRDRAVVAVIGDGALTGGMAWEALNNLGAAPERPVIVVLNDNGRSYAPTTGALAAHLSRLRGLGARATPRNVFTDLGFAYLGPVDGHDIPALESALHRARSLRRPVVVHVVTVKGKGYPPAEADEADCFHAVGVIDPATGRATKPVQATPDHPPARSWTCAFATELLDLAHEREDLVAVTASMLRPTGLHPMAEAFPERVFDVGIAEQHAVTSAAGLAMGGLHPVVAIYATFLNRAIDQILMDVALHRLPVTFVLDRAGVTGPDGPSHHGMWDVSILAVVPGMRVAAPRDATRLRELLREAVAVTDGPTALRLPRENVAPDTPAPARLDGIDVLHRSAHHPLDVLLITTGTTVKTVLRAAGELERHGVGSTVVDPRWLTPVNPTLLHLACQHRLAVTVEDNTRTGGFGSLLAQSAADAGITTPVAGVGLPHTFLPHGPRHQLLTEAGLTPGAIAHTVLRALGVKPPHDAPATAPAVPGKAP